MLVIDRLDRAAKYLVQADDLEHQQALEGPARAAFDALVEALGGAA